VSEEIITHTAEETIRWGREFSKRLKAPVLVLLTGDLGTGKTTLTKGIVSGLGAAKEDDVTSPTFVLINQYRGRLPVYHLDAYRTGSLTELVDLGLEEMLHGDGVTVVEWADKLLPLLPARTIHVHLSGLGDEPREIQIAEPVSDPSPRI